MADRMRILGPDGRPMRRKTLTSEVAAPDGAGVRPVISGHPAQGLTPSRLARLLIQAEQGDPLGYLELAEEMEEKDLHYLGVLSARKRAVTGLEIDVIAASDDANDVENADLVRDALSRDELEDDLFDIMDAVGKGFSATEIIWEMSESQWMPARFEWRDPRWFRFDPEDGRTLLLREVGEDRPLPPFKFIRHKVAAKSGMPIRGGLARAAAWAYLFKNYDVKDWVSFAETYGQPMRVGKYPAGGIGDEERAVLARALANLGSDWAAMIPETMVIELIESKITGNVDLFEKLADWLDRQVSKAVVGQTATTDAIQGGYAVGQVHNLVRLDILTSDAKALSATLTRDVVRPLVALNRGPQPAYPKVRLRVPEAVDMAAVTDALSKLVPMGLKVGQSDIRDMMGLPKPKEDADLLAPAGGAPRFPPSLQPAQARAIAAAAGGNADILDELAREALRLEGDVAVESLLAPVFQLIDGLERRGGDLKQLRELLPELLPDMDLTELADMVARGRFAAAVAGRLEIDPTDDIDD